MANAVRSRWAAGLTVALVVALVGGCAWKGQNALRWGADGDGLHWRPLPTSMRVYPSSRFTRTTEGLTLFEAHLEMLDDMGDSIKAVGDYRLELLAVDESGAIGRRLYVWNVAMLTLDDQMRHYDSVTRTYRLRLRLDEHGQPPSPVALRVLFRPVQGPRLEAQQTLQ
jgi:hypothetical protein